MLFYLMYLKIIFQIGIVGLFVVNVITHNGDFYLLCDIYFFLSTIDSVNVTRKSSSLKADKNSKIAIIVNKFLVLYPAIPISIQ